MKTYPWLNKEYIPETVILANGEFPTHFLPVTLLNHSQYTICCDGAVEMYVQAGYIPSAIVGDLDSLDSNNKHKFASILHADKDQETNDLTKAFQFCLKQNRKKILILGATGKREDHTLANISLLVDYMDQAQVEMVTDYGIFTPVSLPSEIECLPGQPISLFCMDFHPITAIGLKYPLHQRVITRWWQATLNEALGDKFIIQTQGKVIVFRGYLPYI